MALMPHQMNNRTLSRIDDILFGLRSFRAFTDRVRIFVVLPDVLAGQQLSEGIVANIHNSLGKVDEAELRTCTVTNTVNGNQQTQMVHTVTSLGLMGLSFELTRLALRGRTLAAANGNGSNGGNSLSLTTETSSLVDVLNTINKKLRAVEIQMQNAHNECQGVQQDLLEAEARKQVASLRLDEALLHQRASKARCDRVEEDVKLIRLVHSVFSEFDNQKKVAEPVKEMLTSIAHYASSTVALDSVDTRRELHDAVIDNGDECAPFPIDCHVVDDSQSGGSSSSDSSSDRSGSSKGSSLKTKPKLHPFTTLGQAEYETPIRKSQSVDEVLLINTSVPADEKND